MPAITLPFSSSALLWTNATTLIIRPIPASGMLIQFNAPRQGINPINIKTRTKIPNTKLVVFINYFFLTDKIYKRELIKNNENKGILNVL